MDAPAPVQKKSSLYRKSTRKAPAIKNEVIARRVTGQPKAHIARDLGISVNTVKSIIEITDVDRMSEDGRLGCSRLIPQSTDVVKHHLDRNSLTAALSILNPLVLQRKDESASNRPPIGAMNFQQVINVLLHPETASEQPQERVIEQSPANYPSPDTDDNK